MKILNFALFLAVIGFLLVIFGLLMYWSEDKKTYGTCFVSVGGTGIIISTIVAMFSTMQRRLRPAHIIDDPRISYIYNQQYLEYNSRTGSLQMPTHSRDTSTASTVLSIPDLQVVNK